MTSCINKASSAMKLESVQEREREGSQRVSLLRVIAKEIELFRAQLFICKINHPGLYTA